jgi:hypothetical protein
MQGGADRSNILEAEITNFVQSEFRVMALQQHLKEIIEGPAFKGSHRSGQFLQYIVDQSIAGRFELLKERLIGVELFGRPPSYDTGEDAIVRVTASEVRRRLLQHYGGSGAQSEFRLSLPSGSYVPAITRWKVNDAAPVDAKNGNHEHSAALPDATAANQMFVTTVQQPADTVPVAPAPEGVKLATRKSRQWMVFAIILLVLNLGLWALFAKKSFSPAAMSALPLPWSVLFHSPNSTEIITSDPNIAEIQGFTGGEISASDYANHNYLAGPKKLTPEQDYFCRVVLRGDKAASADTPIAVSIAELAQAAVSRKISVRGARDVQLSDLKTDNNFILLGSPRTDPWSGLFSDQLDFRFLFNKVTGREFIFNAKPRTSEQATYVPTAPGWATGESYSILAFLQNPDTNGHILLLAGATAEGTEAAGKLVTDLPRLSQALQQCGLQPPHPAANFEMLLRLYTMAGSPSHVDVIACHVLANNMVH